MTHMEKYFLYREMWKILTDYILWVKEGGEAFYGPVDKAYFWAQQLMSAQNEEMTLATI